MSVVCNNCKHCPKYPHAMDDSDREAWAWVGYCAKHLRLSAHAHVITSLIIITRDGPATTCRHYVQVDPPPSDPPPHNRFQLILAGTTVPEDLG
jgi:hypothetical protein